MLLSTTINAIKRVSSQNPMIYVKSFSTFKIYNNEHKTLSNSLIDEPVEMENPFQKEKVKCILCKHDIEPSYKNVQLLSQFQSPYTGRIYGRHITGLCKSKQEKVEKEIARAQSVGFMGFVTKDVKYLKDPALFDPERPIRNHKY